jgi:hypothetical protein
VLAEIFESAGQGAALDAVEVVADVVRVGGDDGGEIVAGVEPGQGGVELGGIGWSADARCLGGGIEPFVGDQQRGDAGAVQGLGAELRAQGVEPLAVGEFAAEPMFLDVQPIACWNGETGPVGVGASDCNG